MECIVWKNISNLSSFYKFSEDSFVLKVMNSKRLITQPFRVHELNKKLFLKLHILNTLDTIIVGYEIEKKFDFPFVVFSDGYLLFGTNSLRSSSFTVLYEDSYLKVLGFSRSNFLFISKGSVNG